MKSNSTNNAQLESHVQAFLNAVSAAGVQPIETLTPAEARASLAGFQSSVEVDLSGITVTERTISADGQSIRIHIVKPTNAKGTPPVFMFFHGGGWVLGDFPTHERFVRDLVVESGAAAVFVNYAPSPEAHYPVAVNQAYAATKWVAEHGSDIGVDGKRLAVAGNSVGGNMATVVALMSKDNKGPEIKLQVLFCPVTDAGFETGSYNEFGTSSFISRNTMRWFWDHYTTDADERNQVHASPLRASVDQLKGLPPALVQTAESDVLRDEGEAYARKLDEAGVPVTAIRYNGMIHDWCFLNLLATVPATRSALRQAASELKNALK